MDTWGGNENGFTLQGGLDFTLQSQRSGSLSSKKHLTSWIWSLACPMHNKYTSKWSCSGTSTWRVIMLFFNTLHFYPCPDFGIFCAPFLNTLKNPKVSEFVNLLSSASSNATEVAINYASGICICIDFNKCYFLHASFCTCWRITRVLPNTRLFSHSHAPPLTFSWGEMKPKRA